MLRTLKASSADLAEGIFARARNASRRTRGLSSATSLASRSIGFSEARSGQMPSQWDRTRVAAVRILGSLLSSNFVSGLGAIESIASLNHSASSIALSLPFFPAQSTDSPQTESESVKSGLAGVFADM